MPQPPSHILYTIEQIEELKQLLDELPHKTALPIHLAILKGMAITGVHVQSSTPTHEPTTPLEKTDGSTQ